MMKKLLLGIAAIVSLGLMSCNERADLAKSVEGTWSGAPVMLANNAEGDFTVIDTYTFTVDKTGEGGTLMITGMVNGTVPSSHFALSLDQPVSTSVSGRTSVTASWRAIDDDDISVMVDPESFTVTVDPVEMVLTSNVITDATENTPENLSAAAMKKVEDSFRKVIMPHYMELTHMDDVKVKNGDYLKFEVGKKDFSLMRQQAAVAE
ncbi:MAG: hypothetical protein K2M94_01005 [Paramuribaculum sp.]|nr:hypothetical protein [Paramuribaculum sp.]